MKPLQCLYAEQRQTLLRTDQDWLIPEHSGPYLEFRDARNGAMGYAIRCHHWLIKGQPTEIDSDTLRDCYSDRGSSCTGIDQQPDGPAVYDCVDEEMSTWSRSNNQSPRT